MVALTPILQNAWSKAQRWDEPCIVYFDEQGHVAYARLSWYESPEGGAFVSEPEVYAVVDQDGYTD